jgi:hypothetical protein
LCALAVGAELPALAASARDAVGREFLTWYQQLLRMRAQAALTAVNTSLARLGSILPETASVLAEVLSENAETVPGAALGPLPAADALPGGARPR